MEVKPNPPRPRAKRRWLSISIRSLAVLIAIVAISLMGYRRWVDDHTYEIDTHSAMELVYGDPDSHGKLRALKKEITTTIHPESWEANGGWWSIKEFYLSGSLIVRNSRTVHKKIAAFLDQKRAEEKARRDKNRGT